MKSQYNEYVILTNNYKQFFSNNIIAAQAAEWKERKRNK